MKTLKEMNNEIKVYINEAKFISNNCRNKLLKLLGETFSVDLPLENFANIDAQLQENGNIIMRGDEYESKEKVKSLEELEEKYNIFKEKADKLLKKKEKNFHQKKDIDNALNIIIVIVLSVVYLIVLLLTIRAIVSLNLFTASILVALLSSYLHPNIKDRFEQAKNYLRRKFK